jgi:hypothetical protein
VSPCFLQGSGNAVKYQIWMMHLYVHFFSLPPCFETCSFSLLYPHSLSRSLEDGGTGKSEKNAKIETLNKNWKNWKNHYFQIDGPPPSIYLKIMVFSVFSVFSIFFGFFNVFNFFSFRKSFSEQFGALRTLSEPFGAARRLSRAGRSRSRGVPLPL